MPAGVSAYVPLANVTLGSAVQTVSFTSINQTYRDLVVVVNAIPSGTVNWAMLFNNQEDGGTYSYVNIYGTGSSAGSNGSASTGRFQLDVSGILSSNRVQANINLTDYSSTVKHKSVLWRYTNVAYETNATIGRWANTSAVTSIQLRAGSSTWQAGSTFALYGVSA